MERIDVHTFGGDATGRYSLHALVFERYGMTNGRIEMGESDTHFVREIFDSNITYISCISVAYHMGASPTYIDMCVDRGLLSRLFDSSARTYDSSENVEATGNVLWTHKADGKIYLVF